MRQFILFFALILSAGGLPAVTLKIQSGANDTVAFSDGSTGAMTFVVGYYSSIPDFTTTSPAAAFGTFNPVATFSYDGGTPATVGGPDVPGFLGTSTTTELVVDPWTGSPGVSDVVGKVIYTWVFDSGFSGTFSSSSQYGLFNQSATFLQSDGASPQNSSMSFTDAVATYTQVRYGSVVDSNLAVAGAAQFRLAANAAPVARFAFSSATANVDESAGSLTVTIQRSGVTTSAVTVEVSTSNGTALAGTDFTAISPAQTVTFIANDTEETVIIPIANRSGFQGSRTFNVLLGNPLPSGQAELGTIITQTVTINDTEPAGITVSPTSGLVTTEAGGSDTFTVVLNRPPTANVTIPLASSNTNEGTVSVPSLVFTPANWNVAQMVTVTGADDSVDDGDIAYTIEVQAATSADAAYNGINASDVSVTNQDNDAAGATLPGAPLATTEAGGTANFTVVLESQPTADVIIDIASSKPAEGVPSPTPLTFTTANWNVAQAVTVTGQDDSVADGPVAYEITFTVTSADVNYNGLVIPAISASNADNDTAGVVATPLSGLVTSESGGTATVKVRLSSQPLANVVIPVSSNDTTEGTASPSSLTFTPANWNIEQNVTLTGVDDLLVDGPVGYTVTLGPPTSTNTTYAALAAVVVSATNNDNDSAGLTVNPTAGLVTTEAGGTATFSIKLNTAPSADVTIALSSSDTTEGTVSPSSVILTPANWDTAQTVTITGVNDNVDDGDIAYTIITAPATSADANYNGLNASDVAVTNTDDDSAGFVISPTSGLVTTEAGGQAMFTVRLSSEPLANVNLPLSSSNPAEGTVTPSGLVFTAANWNTPQTVTATGVDDLVRDGNIAYTIITGNPASTDPLYNGAGANPVDVAVTNLDDDAASVVVSPTSGLVTTEAGGTATFTLVLTSQPTGTVVIPLSIGGVDPDEATVSPLSVTFNAGNWNVAQVVTVTGVNDSIVDGTRPYTVVTGVITGTDTSGYVGQNPDDVAGSNLDNDSANFTVTPTSGLITSEATGPQKTATFTVVLSAQPTANVGFVVTSLDTSEGTVSPGTLTFTNANWNTPQTVTVTGADDFLDDGDVPYQVSVGPSTSSEIAFAGLAAKTVSLVNLDNDELASARLSASAFSVNEGSSVTIGITLSGHPGAGASIPVAYRTINGSAAAGRDYETRTGTVTFTNNGTQNITIPTINDTDPENNEVFFFEILPPPPLALYGLTSPSLATITINRNSEGLDQPDLLVGFDQGGGTQYSGSNVYNTSGDGQIAFRQQASQGASQTYRVRVQNDGPISDSVTITGIKAFTRVRDFKVEPLTEAQARTSIKVRHGGKDVTSQVFGSGLVLSNVRKGQTTELAVTISTSSSTPKGTNIGVTLTGTSANTSSKRDAVRCLMGVKP